MVKLDLSNVWDCFEYYDDNTKTIFDDEKFLKLIEEEKMG
jgi:hypothetical protein